MESDAIKQNVRPLEGSSSPRDLVNTLKLVLQFHFRTGIEVQPTCVEPLAVCVVAVSLFGAPIK